MTDLVQILYTLKNKILRLQIWCKHISLNTEFKILHLIRNSCQNMEKTKRLLSDK